jgi:hypothetical protein
MDADDVAGTTGAPAGEPHLSPDRLAALADNPATSSEALHLSTCPTCTAEVDAYLALLALTRAERDRLSAPISSWEPLRAELARDGLLTGPGRRAGSIRGFRAPTWAWRSTVAACLVGGSFLAGRVSSRPPAPSATLATTSSQSSANITPVQPQASDIIPAASQRSFQSRDEAIAAVLNAETAYRHAVAYLMVADTADQGTGLSFDYRTRLAALDEVTRTTRAALVAAPHDPVLKRVYLNSVDAREATIRELGRALPAGLQLGQY